MRQFMHRSLWLNDPDCLLLRPREIELTRNERELYALTAGALDNLIVDSDRLALLGPEEKGLFRRALALRGGRARVEGLLGELGTDVYVVDSRGGPAGRTRLAVNLSDGNAVIDGKALPPRTGTVLG
jgi:alpha-galactosidase